MSAKVPSMKKRKISRVITNRLALALVLVFCTLFLIIATSTQHDTSQRQRGQLTLLAQKNAAIIEAAMETPLSKQQVLAESIRYAQNLENSQRVEMLRNILNATKAGQNDVLSMFIVLEPNAVVEETPDGMVLFASDSSNAVSQDVFSFIDKTVYETAKNGKATLIADPFKKMIDGKEYNVVSILTPVLGANGNVMAVIGSNVDTGDLDGLPFDKGGYQTTINNIVCGHKTLIMHSTNPDAVGKPFLEVSKSSRAQEVLDSASQPGEFILTDVDSAGVEYMRAYVPFYVGESKVVWLSGTHVETRELNKAIYQNNIIIIGVMLAGLVLIYLLSLATVRKSLKPIAELENAAAELSKGNLHVNIKCRTNDELGNLANSLRESIETLYSYVTDIDRAMGLIASGNLNLGPSQPFIGDFSNIEKSITKMIVSLTNTIGAIDMSADEVAASSELVASSSQTLSEGASEQAGTVEELVATITEIAQRAHNNAESAQSANKLANSVGMRLGASNEQMSQLMNAMNEINSSSIDIGKINKTIEDLAFQTNILALNAAVEAARAGNAGKGFAVVADEVKNLASKSSEASKQTSELIKNSNNVVNKGLQIAAETSKSLNGVVGGAQEITVLINQIAESSSEQSSAVSHINVAVEQISQIVQMNSATSEETAAASQELSGQAEELKRLVDRFILLDTNGK